MITGSYTRTFENEKGLVHLTVVHSDVTGSSIMLITRYGDNRADRTSGWDNLLNPDQAVRVGDEWFEKEVRSL